MFMIALDVNDDELRKRIMERGKISGRADDQNIDIVNNRIKVYNDQTLPVMEYYKSKNKLALIDGIGTLGEVFERICKQIKL
jgi:adenylate kinase